jgi:hypothetical protein
VQDLCRYFAGVSGTEADVKGFIEMILRNTKSSMVFWSSSEIKSAAVNPQDSALGE